MTLLIPWTAADFADSFQRHLPTGPVWPRDSGTTQRAAIEALMPTYQRTCALACALPAETLPSSTTYLIDEWESSVGLPDPCAASDQSIEQARAHVVARLTQSNGPDIPSLVSFAATLGYPITITEFVPRRFGQVFGLPFNGDAWAHAWQVNAPTFSIEYRQFGDAFGEFYATWDNTVLQCEMQRIAPAHTTLMFNYD